MMCRSTATGMGSTGRGLAGLLALLLLAALPGTAAATASDAVAPSGDPAVGEAVGPGLLPRIYNGIAASIADLPEVVLLYVENPDGGSSCTGSVIAPRWVLTAAHCFDGAPEPTASWVIVGRDRRPEVLEPTFAQRPRRVVIHPDWPGPDGDAFVGDLALVELSEVVAVPPVPLVPATSPDPIGAQVVVAGWGLVAEGDLTDRLMRSTMRVTTDTTCRFRRYVPGVSLCLQGQDTTVCRGDSGGPVLQTGADGVRRQVAVSVATDGRCGPHSLFLAISMSVAAYRSWIDGVMGVAPDPDPGPDPSPEPDPDPEPDPAPEPDPDPAPDPAPEPDPDPAPDPAPEPDPDPAPLPPEPPPAQPPTLEPVNVAVSARAGVYETAWFAYPATRQPGIGTRFELSTGIAEVASVHQEYLRRPDAPPPPPPPPPAPLERDVVAPPVGPGAEPTQRPTTMSLGHRLSCGLLQNGLPVCWGLIDERAQTTPPQPPAAQIVVGDAHGCVLYPDRTFRCWGRDPLVGEPPEDQLFAAISAGPNQTCGLTPEGRPVCWGLGMYTASSSRPPPDAVLVELSLGGIAYPRGPYHSCGLEPDGTVRCWSSADLHGQASPPPGLRLATVSAGGAHTCGLDAQGRAHCWGLDDEGQASPPPGETFVEVSAGGYHTCAVRPDGVPRCWGRSTGGQTDPPPGLIVSRIATGYEHSCGIRAADGTAACWGVDVANETLTGPVRVFAEEFTDVAIEADPDAGPDAQGAAGPGTRSSRGSGFPDVGADDVHAPGIVAVAAGGITTGYPDGSFRPGEPVTRGQMATFLARALDLDDPGGQPFPDVPVDAVHAPGIRAVAAAGIAGGFVDGTFGAGAPVTRAQMATFLARAADLPPGTLPAPFSDVPDAATHAASISAVAAAGIAGGLPDGTYRPERAVTRAQMATFLFRAFLDGQQPAPDPSPDPDPSPEPTPDPEPSPEPTPDPEPSPEPTPDPDPDPDPLPEALPDLPPWPDDDFDTTGRYSVPLRIVLPDVDAWQAFSGTITASDDDGPLGPDIEVAIQVVRPNAVDIPRWQAPPRLDQLLALDGGGFVVAERLLVELEPGLPDPDELVRLLARRLGAAIVGSLPDHRLVQLQLHGATSVDLDVAIAEAEDVDGVAFARRQWVARGRDYGHPSLD